jgi:hypothetical protein
MLDLFPSQPPALVKKLHTILELHLTTSPIGWCAIVIFKRRRVHRLSSLAPLTALSDGSKLAKMKPATVLTILLASALAFGPKNAKKFEVLNLSASDSPISFSGTAKALKIGTACVVTAHNNSSQSLLAMVATADVATPYEWDQPVTFQYDGFSKEALIDPGLDFDVVDEGLYPINGNTYDANGVPVDTPPQKFACHAKTKVLFVQFADGSSWGDYQTGKDVMARRAKRMAILSHLVEAYDTGGETAFAAALEEPQAVEMAWVLKGAAEYDKITVIELARKRLAAAKKKQESGIF